MPPRKSTKPRTFRNDYRPLAVEIEAARNEFDVRKFSKADAEVRRKFRISVLRLAVALPTDIIDALSLMRTVAAAGHHYLDAMRGYSKLDTAAQGKALISAQKHVVALLRVLSGATTDELLEVTGDTKLAKRKRREAKRALESLSGPTMPIEFAKTPNARTMERNRRGDPLALERAIASYRSGSDIPVVFDLRTKAAKEAVARGDLDADWVRLMTYARRAGRYNRLKGGQKGPNSYAR